MKSQLGKLVTLVFAQEDGSIDIWPWLKTQRYASAHRTLFSRLITMVVGSSDMSSKISMLQQTSLLSSELSSPYTAL